MISTSALADRLPDIARYVELRDLLSSGECELFGLREEPELSLVLFDPMLRALFVLGTPGPEALAQALDRDAAIDEIVTFPECADWVEQALPEWHRFPAILHLLHHPERLPPPSNDVGWFDPEMIDRLSIDEELRHELHIGAQVSMIASTFVAGEPVSFCYAGAVTESLWDIAIDTVAGHRRKGHAASCVAFMIRHMETLGKQPVWGALVENPASWRLAEKLGFVAVDELIVLEKMTTGQQDSGTTG